jgi:hypothetical protein
MMIRRTEAHNDHPCRHCGLQPNGDVLTTPARESVQGMVSTHVRIIHSEPRQELALLPGRAVNRTSAAGIGPS